MTILSRRGFMAGVALTSATLAGSRAAAAVPPLLLHDPGLAAGRRFAARATALDGESIAIEGERVRCMQALLARRPSALFGVTRRADALLIGEIAGEAGYRPVASVRHGADRMVADCTRDGAAIAALARLAGAGWPEAFADLALRGVARCKREPSAVIEPAFSWMLVRRQG
ncbi:hypothetical protein DM806_02085 [Sphingobium lactosutens]|uniref:hypothetical protein n=1 Tax=Sphingobium lactosutens TaxID=522773 RepID=UPI0015BF6B0D|nr:hypothetical protein [Sphingobium lactosutens]NWK94485.1 hypothetical protein [Sphingobium lactosutens]